MNESVEFYTIVLGMKVDKRYTLHAPKHEFGKYSYVQLGFQWPGSNVAIGLFKDIENPFPKADIKNPLPGTVPTFVVADLDGTCNFLRRKGIAVSDIKSNTSDEGFLDHFAFIADIDNNLLCIRQDMN